MIASGTVDLLPSLLSTAALAVLADAALKTTAILLAAGLASLALRRASSALRHAVWLAAVCGSLALPALALALPAWNVTIAWEPAAPASEEPAISEDEPAPSIPAIGLPLPAPGRADSEPTPAPRLDWRAAAVLVWLLGAALVAVRTARAAWKIRAIARGAVRAGKAWTEAGCVAAERLGLRRPTPLLVSERVATPATLGIFKPAILLPAASEKWSTDRQVAALLHELAHVERRDCATQLAAQIACALYWFNPLIWAAARALREEREHAADDRVLGSGVRASDYAGLLLDVARTAPASLPLPAASFASARHSHLERRLRAILDPRRPRRPAGRAVAALGFLAATCAVAPLAAARPTAAQDPVTAPVDYSLDVANEPSPAAEVPNPSKRAQSSEKGTQQGRPMIPSPHPTPTPTPSPEPEPAEYEYTTEDAPAASELPQTAVVAALQEALHDEDRGVREQAKWALDMIRLRNGHIPAKYRSRSATPRTKGSALKNENPVEDEHDKTPEPEQQ